MNWKKFSEEMPPINKDILIGKFSVSYLNAKEDNIFSCYKGYLVRPFDFNDMYNPDYYDIYYRDIMNQGYKKEKLTKELYWCEIVTPIK